MKLIRKAKDGSYRDRQGSRVDGVRVLKDMVFIFLIGFVSILFYLLDAKDIPYFVLNLNNLNVVSWFSSNFIHANFVHLFGNMVFYFLAALLLYLSIPKKREVFYGVTISLLIAYPILQIVVLLLFRSIGLYPQQLIFNVGFSGIVSAFVASLALPLAYEVHNITGISIKNSAVFLFALSMFGVSYRYHDWRIFVLILILLAIMIILSRKDFKPNKKQFEQYSNWNVFVLTASFVFLVIISFQISTLNISTDGVTNIVVHYLGFTYGFFNCFLIDYLLRR